jgi:competence protein ComGC
MLDSRRNGVTRAELLVIAAISIVLLGLILPAIRAVRDAAARVQCANNIKLVTLAAQNANDSYGYVPSNPDTVNDRFGTTQDHLQPFLE